MAEARYGKDTPTPTRSFEWPRCIIISKNSLGEPLVVMRFYILGCAR